MSARARILETAAATLVMMSFAQACGDSGGPAPPAIITMLSADSQAATVGSAVATLPSVLVQDANHRSVQEVAVTFAVASGGGSLSGALDTSDANGVATVGGWTLGMTMGSNTMTATVAGLPPVTFTALATAAADWVVTKQAGDNQSGTVGTAVATPPAVMVKDVHGNAVAGAIVAYVVSSGGGSLTGGKVSTDTSGIAAVGSWTLGTASGSDTLTATVAGLAPVTFAALGVAGPPAAVTKHGGDNQTGAAGTAVAAPPSVVVPDALANPVVGATVTFAVGSGGGNLTGGTATTDASGVATVGSWRLGATIGSNTLTATVSGLPAVTFTAAAIVGPAATVTKQAGDQQTASIGSAVATRPAVVVKDAFGNAVRGAGVTFAVALGGGSVTGGTTNTDVTGSATVGNWTLGQIAGANTLAATVQGLPAVTFTAIAVDPCITSTAYTIGSTVTGALAAGDCRLNGNGLFADLYSTTTSAAVSVRLDLSSTDFSTYLYLFDASGSTIAYNTSCYDDYFDGVYCPNLNSSVRVLLSPADYIVSASSYFSATGNYALSSAVLPEDVTGCGAIFVTRGLTTSQRIDTTDCAATFRSSKYYSDQFVIQLTAGQTYTITMSSAAFDTYLELWGGGTIASNDDFGGTKNSQLTFTPTQSGTYVINAATYLGNATGAYTLAIQ